MNRNNDNKIKLLILWEILKNETDESAPLTTAQLCSMLYSKGIECERRTLSMDINALNSFGFEVMSTTKGHSKAYYVADRGFSTAEIKILVDAIQASNFITEKKTAEYSEKLAALSGRPKSEIFKQNIICFNPHKHSNEAFIYSVSTLENAVKKHQITFQYFSIDETKKRRFHHDGELYRVDPLALIYNNDNYYLIAFNGEETRTYRIDRMVNVTDTELPLSEKGKQKLKSLNIIEYTSELFGMFNGKQEKVTLEFSKAYLDQIYDKFGERITVSRSGTDKLKIKAVIRESPPFFGWLAQYYGEIKILAPQSVINNYKDFLQNCLNSININD